MPQLKTTEVHHYQVDYSELDRFMTEVYGREFKFVAAEECGNDSSHTFNIIKNDLNEYDLKEIDDYKSGARGYMYLTRSLLADCCDQGLIPEGDYLVDVCW